jgi:putative IMPACT (imprinted ancient) family translation regulator
LGLDKNNFRVSDNGEPSGTAGRPILGQIDSKELTNVVVFVVRYFGGTLLGVPGLINAYKSAAALALQTTPIIQKPITVAYNLQFDYTQLNTILAILKQFRCIVIKQDLQLFCAINVGIARKSEEEVLKRLNETRGVTITKMI